MLRGEFRAYDEYVRVGGAWKIEKTRCVITSTLVLQLGEEGVKRLFAGNAPPAMPA